MTRALKGILVFTGIEVLTMLGWLFFALRGNILGVVILTAGLFVEHYVALQVDAGRPIFGPLPPD